MSEIREARYYQTEGNDKVRCLLCPHTCTLSEGKLGICRVRANRGGKLVALSYGRWASFAVDPIEKKPLYHFYPGSVIFSAGTAGCNLKCRFCQNHALAHGSPQTRYVEADKLVALVQEHAPESIGIAFTYNEPLVGFEYLLEAAAGARKAGLKNVLVTNGYVNRRPLAELLPLVDAMNIDLKAFSEDFYLDFTGGSLEPVKNTIVQAKQSGCHVEITTLLITGENDSAAEVGCLSRWLAEKVGKDTPLHLSRYFPAYKHEAPATPLAVMERAYEIAGTYLDYVYLGNTPELDRGNTHCPQCGAVAIRRSGYRVAIECLTGSKCTQCGCRLAVIR